MAPATSREQDLSRLCCHPREGELTRKWEFHRVRIASIKGLVNDVDIAGNLIGGEYELAIVFDSRRAGFRQWKAEGEVRHQEFWRAEGRYGSQGGRVTASRTHDTQCRIRIVLKRFSSTTRLTMDSKNWCSKIRRRRYARLGVEFDGDRFDGEERCLGQVFKCTAGEVEGFERPRLLKRPYIEVPSLPHTDVSRPPKRVRRITYCDKAISSSSVVTPDTTMSMSRIGRPSPSNHQIPNRPSEYARLPSEPGRICPDHAATCGLSCNTFIPQEVPHLVAECRGQEISRSIIHC